MRRLLVVAAAIGVASCASPTAPASAPRTAPLTAHVFEFAHQATPIAGATVRLTSAVATIAAVTDADGRAVLEAPIGVPVDVQAYAPGYESFSAGGTLAGEEAWTFWLMQ